MKSLLIVASAVACIAASAAQAGTFTRMSDGSCQLSMRHKVGKLPPPNYDQMLIELALCKGHPKDAPLDLLAFRAK